MAKIRYLKATFDSHPGRIREVSLANARALVSMKLAEYYVEEPKAVAKEVTEEIVQVVPETQKEEKVKRGRPAKK